jgi:hypothetical protein
MSPRAMVDAFAPMLGGGARGSFAAIDDPDDNSVFAIFSRFLFSILFNSGCNIMQAQLDNLGLSY